MGISPLHSSLGDRVSLCLKKIKKMKDNSIPSLLIDKARSLEKDLGTSSELGVLLQSSWSWQ